MKKAVSFVLILSIALLLVFSLVACNNTDKIVGTWRFSNLDFSYGDNLINTDFDFDSTLNFKSDGTVTNEYNQTAYWSYNSKTKEYIISDRKGETTENDIETAYIDKNGVLHIDAYTFKKA